MKLSDIGKEREQQSLQELFEVELEKVIENIMDKRTYPGDKRKIQINVIVVPKSERDKVRLTYDIKTTLAPIMGGETGMDIITTITGKYETRPSISTSRIPGQVDYRDVLPDDDGVYPEEE
ncbi:MAG: hypothetical protein BI182_08300 [Acetobacterium sp. MES1]|jgi:hypothetical protein|uniref:hypothetical protein n=1 Tax=Acetobacterium sp. MES1 TaxID=1899015 RepID=UPI000B9D4A88|nr:hypothetical protein [Acetobacterium sp. MES1]OXS26388.1 MAG: hypothetical protein BI182_08300 [Acetobacterium sp. MES1]